MVLRHLNHQEDWLKTAVISQNGILSITECRWHLSNSRKRNAIVQRLTKCHIWDPYVAGSEVEAYTHIKVTFLSELLALKLNDDLVPKIRLFEEDVQ